MQIICKITLWDVQMSAHFEGPGLERISAAVCEHVTLLAAKMYLSKSIVTHLTSSENTDFLSRTEHEKNRIMMQLLCLCTWLLASCATLAGARPHFVASVADIQVQLCNTKDQFCT